MRVEIVVFDGFDELDAIGPYEVLRNAALAGADLDVALVTRDGAPTVTAAHGLQLMTQGTHTEWPDVLVVPGGGWNDRASRGARAEVERGDLPAMIARAHAAGTAVVSPRRPAPRQRSRVSRPRNIGESAGGGNNHGTDRRG